MDTAEAFDILGVSRNATQVEIRAAYLRLSRQVHSDTGGSDGLFRQVKLAYDTLSNTATSQRPQEPRGTWSEWYREDQRNAQDGSGQQYDGSSPFKKWLRANPSLALLFFGSVAMILGLRFGAGALLITLLGTIAVMLGLAGVMGAKQIRAEGRAGSGGALLRSQLRAGIPQLLRKVGKAILVTVGVLLALSVATSHSGKVRNGR
jgi:curved DNA-binding protein CbpA